MIQGDENGRRRRVYRAIFDIPGPKEIPTPEDWIRLNGGLPTKALADDVRQRVEAEGSGVMGRSSAM